MFSIEIDEDKLIATWARAVNEIKVGVIRGVGNGVRIGAAASRAMHTFKNRTGNLERSITHIVVGWQGDEYVARIVAREKYASFVEKGTPPHLIVGNPFLTFEWKGELVHFRYVNHPGQKVPLPFMYHAHAKCEDVATKEIELSVERAGRILDR